MRNCCDYDVLAIYPSGTFCTKHRTVLDGKLQEIDQLHYNEEITASFQGNTYRTYMTLEPLVLYRVFGQYGNPISGERPKGAQLKGAFASTEFAESIIDAKMRLALNPAWANTKMYEARLLIPTGTTVSVGIVAAIRLKSGTLLPGGADQVLLPFNWPDDWITGYRRLTGRQLQTTPHFRQEPPSECVSKQELYRGVCPACGCEDIQKLSQDQQFTIIGCKGRTYTMQNVCLNPACQYYW